MFATFVAAWVLSDYFSSLSVSGFLYAGLVVVHTLWEKVS